MTSAAVNGTECVDVSGEIIAFPSISLKKGRPEMKQNFLGAPQGSITPQKHSGSHSSKESVLGNGDICGLKKHSLRRQKHGTDCSCQPSFELLKE